MDLGKIQRNMNRSRQIISYLGGYEKFLKFMNDDFYDSSGLKQEIKSMNKEMEDMGIMTIENFDDPEKRRQFYNQHSKIIIGFD